MENIPVKPLHNPRIWKNKALHYQFSYPPSATIAYSGQTPDGACTYVFLEGREFELKVAISDLRAMDMYPVTAGTACFSTDFPNGIKRIEPTQMQTLAQEVPGECYTSYYHQEDYDADPTNNTLSGRLIDEIPVNSIDGKRCYFNLGGDDSLEADYELTVDYGKSISVSEGESMDSIARAIIGSVEMLR
jgi:hypothetical protein